MIERNSQIMIFLNFFWSWAERKLFRPEGVDSADYDSDLKKVAPTEQKKQKKINMVICEEVPVVDLLQNSKAKQENTLLD